MTDLKMIGWKENLQTISLTQAIRDFSTLTLAEGKIKVEELISGQSVIIKFESDSDRQQFKEKAEFLGAVFE